MSQPNPELSTPGLGEGQEEGSIDDIAADMGEGDDQPEDDDEPADNGGADEHADPDAEGHEDDDPEEEWEAGGKKIRVKRSELRAGYMKDADYRQKTAELADQRRAVEQHAQAIQQERQQAANQLDVYLQALHRELIGTQPDQSLIESDPQEYLRQNALHQQRTAQFQQALQHRQALAGRMSADEQRQRAEWQQGEAKKLQQALPTWSDPKVRERESAEIAEYLGGMGYTQDEMGELVDSRALLVARDAAMYRKQLAAKAKQQKTDPGRTVRPGAAADPGRANAARVTAANDRLRRNPDSLDALVGYARERGGV